MSPDVFVGRTGRAATEVAATGQVEIGGESFDALTVGPPVPAGAAVEVTGWRLIDGTRYVLSVREPRPDAPVNPTPVPPRPPAAAWVTASDDSPTLPPRDTDREWGQILLTFGVVASVLGAVVATGCGLLVLLGAMTGVLRPFILAVLQAISCLLAAAWMAAMSVVFSRVKRLP
ncbi:NfeD family protein [bacterium]|nr:NfeD family protein [bacterium]